MVLEKIEDCPLCQEKSLKPFLTCKDYTVSGNLFHVEQCSSCGMTLTNPRPTADTSGQYYKSAQYISHTAKSSGIIDRIYLIIRYFTIRWKYRLIKPLLKNNGLLDIGCGTGSFASYCKLKGANVTGIEPSPEARSKASEQKLEVFQSLEQLSNFQFDVITLWHVLEHIYNLEETLILIKNKLSKGGTIFIAVPNFESEDASHYKEEWAAYDVPRHVWHFSKKTMERLLEKNGLRIVDKIPMKLDAYYVSLLSEKNLSGGKLPVSKAIQAIFTGFRSNRKAKDAMNYSSLIYRVEE